MTREKIMEEYRRLNSEDRGTFQSWLLTNTVVGAMAFFALIAAALVYSGVGSNIATAQKEKVTVYDEAR
jgi:hypothetical protein